MRVEVVSVTSRVPDRTREPYYRYDVWLASLARFGATPTVLGMDESWGGLMTKPRRLRQWLREGRCEADALVVCDSYDVVFTASPEEVGERWGGGEAVTFNAERGLFPRGDLAYAFPDPGTPWRYLNSGLFVGRPATVLRLLDALSLDDLADDHVAEDDLHGGAGRWVHPNDQGWYQFLFAAQPVPMQLDCRCRTFQCLSACSAEEFDLSGERARNVITDTCPLVWHFNGGSKNDLLPLFLERWGLG